MNPLVRCTLLELLWHVNDVATDVQEATAVATSLVNSGLVQLCGNFAGSQFIIGAEAASGDHILSSLANAQRSAVIDTNSEDAIG